VPGIAPAAKQGGHYAADVIATALHGGPKPAPFRYRHQGNLATIGRHAAIVDLGGVRLTGWVAWWLWGLAWWLWGLAHIYFLIGVRAPVIVAAQWFWAYLTFGRGARLITELQPLFEDLKMPNDGSRIPADSRSSAADPKRCTDRGTGDSSGDAKRSRSRGTSTGTSSAPSPSTSRALV
jgi:NADH dehydrogenase